MTARTLRRALDQARASMAAARRAAANLGDTLADDPNLVGALAIIDVIGNDAAAVTNSVLDRVCPTEPEDADEPRVRPLGSALH
ncbi:hypothetical protein [Methylobacterium radiodurans]|uniref:Uncharacterized protein n=1 Tax=Methylobacterium radiodurans TaxID=2202828 RepID=A0A2U8VS32_9HYPH|nr:hypothetical protein [Methylobacterium radiodurans]AWN36523.1 hypothetical protein DK427_12945 [Methylobacterium radiodurans]